MKTNKYIYHGPVVSDNLTSYHWNGETYAISEKKAITNLKYHFRKENGLPLNCKIEFPGKIKIVEEVIS